jgi:uncharacterized RDD family membrane protein YckC
MYTVDALRERYARSSDADLLALLAVDPERLTPESRQALAEETRRRGLESPPEWASVPVAAAGPAGFTSTRRYLKAPFGTRLLAYIVDGIVSVGTVALAVATVFFTNLPRDNRFAAFAVVAAAVLWTIYYSFTKDGRDGGQSIGMEMLNLMVVNTTTNAPCSTGESALRALVLFALNLVPVVGWLIEPIFALSDPDGRRLGDRAANTQVIRTSDYVPTIG